MTTRNTHTLTMNRHGNFKIYTYGNSHCGTLTDDFLPIKYHLICQCEKILDSRGFLFEQVGVDQYFKKLRRTRLSCERLTINCVKQLMSRIRQDNPSCRVRSIELTLSPYPYAASMTYGIEPRQQQ